MPVDLIVRENIMGRVRSFDEADAEQSLWNGNPMRDR